MKKYISHKTAVIETDDIGEGTIIGPFTYIGNRVKIGKNCKIFGASIGLPGQHISNIQNDNGLVIIGDNVEIREFVTINCPLFGDSTYVGDDSYLMASAHVGHDSYLSYRVILVVGASVAGSTKIGKYSYMGLNSSTHPFSELGDYCLIGANSFFKGKSPNSIIWAGVPAKPLKINKIGLDRYAPKELYTRLLNSAIIDFENLRKEV